MKKPRLNENTIAKLEIYGDTREFAWKRCTKEA